MRSDSLTPRWAIGVMAGFLLLQGCGAALENIALESRPAMRIHVPPKVQVGRPFPVVVDVDAACGEFKRLAIDENGITETITVDVMFKPPPAGVACIAAIVLQRFEGQTTATTVGTYAVNFKGYNGRFARTLEVVAGEVPSWTAPTFDPTNATTNY